MKQCAKYFFKQSSNTDINFRPKTQLFISEAGVRPRGKFRKKKYPTKASESHRCTAFNYQNY